MTDCTWGTFPFRGVKNPATTLEPRFVVHRASGYTCADSYVPLYSENKDRKRELDYLRTKEKEGEMGKGMLGGVRYVLSACLPLYSSYCITGLALLPHGCRPLTPCVEQRGYPIIHIQYPSRLHFAVHTFPECITAESL